MLDRLSTAEAVSESAKPFRGRRLTWQQFYALRPDLRPANDNRATLVGVDLYPARTREICVPGAS